MPDTEFLTLPVPELPRAHYVAEGYYTSAYFTLGPEAGHPLVLCHGLAANGLQFVNDAHYFAGQGFNVIVPDLRGHGRSIMPDAKVRTNEDFSFEQMASDLVGILDAERVEKTHWVGNSLGGILALSLMGSNRERLGRFVCFGTSFSMNLPPFSMLAMQIASRLMRREHLYQVGARVTCIDDPAAQAIIYAMLKQADRDCVTRIIRHLLKYDFIANALAFDGPVLMLRGMRDTSINNALGPTLAAMANHTYFFTETVGEAGHCANLDRPDFMRNKICDFIGSRTGETPGSLKP